MRKLLHWAICVAIAGLGAGLASMAVNHWVIKDGDTGGGFIQRKDGLGLDDAVLWLGMGVGAYAALKLTHKG